MTPPEALVATLCGCGVAMLLALVLDVVHREYRAWRRDQLDREWVGSHDPIRRRMRGLTYRDGLSTHTERRVHGRGWVWIATNTHEEAMGLAWTRQGARRRLAAFLDKGAYPEYLILLPRKDRK